MSPVYLDYNATTPVDPVILDEMRRIGAEYLGNPSSIHRFGRQSRAFLDECRERVASVWACRPARILFTSGATESNNLALLGVARGLPANKKHLVTSAMEHPSVLEPLRWLALHEGFDLTEVRPSANGVLSPDAVDAALRPETGLVSIQAANNETGALQPIPAIGRVCKERGIRFHTDAVQWFGKEQLRGIAQFNADLVTCSAHKIHGPKGAGILFADAPSSLRRLIHGGSQESDLRAGTENLPAIAGMALAVERFCPSPVFDAATLRPLTEQIVNCLMGIRDVRVLAPEVPRLANTVAFVADACDSLSLLAALDLDGFCASGGAACSTGTLRRSHVLLAMGFPPDRAGGLIRISIGRETTQPEIDRLTDRLPHAINQVRNG